MKIGDIIKAKINHSGGAYGAGDEFALEGVSTCKRCGKEWVDIGIPENGHTHARCICGHMIVFQGHRLFWKSNFDKAEKEDSYMTQLIKKAMKPTLLFIILAFCACKKGEESSYDPIKVAFICQSSSNTAKHVKISLWECEQNGVKPELTFSIDTIVYGNVNISAYQKRLPYAYVSFSVESEEFDINNISVQGRERDRLINTPTCHVSKFSYNHEYIEML